MAHSALKRWSDTTLRLVQLLLTALFITALLAPSAQAASATSNGITFSDTSLVAAQRGVAYETMTGSTTNLNLRVSGGTGPYSYQIVSGALPTGLWLSTSGQISGVSCLNNGSFKFTVAITDATNTTGTFALQINMTAGPAANLCSLTLTPGNLSDTIQAGQSYTKVITASGGIGAPYTFSLASGSLPNGLTLNSNGTISGTPTTVGTFSFNLFATDGAGNGGYQFSTITVTAVPTVVISPATLPNGINGTPYSQALTPSGGVGPYSCVASGSLPADLTITGNTISGTPAAVGTYTFTVTCTDANGLAGSRTYTLTIEPGAVLTLAPTTLPDGTASNAYNQSVTATGGTGTGYVYSIDAGSLPANLSLNASTGAITGTPTAAGTSTFTVRAVDSAGNFTTQSYSLVIVAPTILISPATLPNATNGSAYSQALTPSGGVGPYTCAVTAGSLPASLSLTGNTITGTPNAAGSASFTITCTDANGFTGSRAYTLTISPGAVLALAPTSLPSGTNGMAYSQSVTASGGTGTGYVYSVTAGSLPTSLSLNSATGAITGTASAAGTFNFTVRAVDSAGNYTTRAYSIVIDPGPLLILGPASLSAPTQGVGYAATVVATGGSGTGYTYSITTGSLPAGLSLNAGTGVISGSTVATGAYTFTVRAVDSQGNWGTRSYTFSIIERADPSRDPEVRALIDGQFRSASRFAEGQLNNVMRHMESLHDGLRCDLQNDLQLSAGLPGTTGSQAGAAGNAAGNAAGSSAVANPVAASCDDAQPKFGMWISGSVSRETENLNRLTGDALSMGIDLQVARGAIIGASGGFGWNESRLGNNGTLSRDHAGTVVAYASLAATDRVFVDLAFGKTWTTLDGKRRVTADQSFATMRRKGTIGFGSAALTLEQPIGPVLLAGQARYDHLDIDLDAVRELGANPYGLTFQASQQTVKMLSVGLRAQTTVRYTWGKLVPSGRIELRHRATGAYDQTMAYSDLLSRTYVLRRAATRTDSVGASLGARAIFGLTEVGLEYGTSASALGDLGGGELRMSLRKGF